MTAINPGNWSAAWINRGGIKPPENVMKLFQSVVLRK